MAVPATVMSRKWTSIKSQTRIINVGRQWFTMITCNSSLYLDTVVYNTLADVELIPVYTSLERGDDDLDRDDASSTSGHVVSTTRRR